MTLGKSSQYAELSKEVLAIEMKFACISLGIPYINDETKNFNASLRDAFMKKLVRRVLTKVTKECLKGKRVQVTSDMNHFKDAWENACGSLTYLPLLGPVPLGQFGKVNPVDDTGDDNQCFVILDGESREVCLPIAALQTPPPTVFEEAATVAGKETWLQHESVLLRATRHDQKIMRDSMIAKHESALRKAASENRNEPTHPRGDSSEQYQKEIRKLGPKPHLPNVAKEVKDRLKHREYALNHLLGYWKHQSPCNKHKDQDSWETPRCEEVHNGDQSVCKWIPGKIYDF